jgi:hypothetical protein
VFVLVGGGVAVDVGGRDWGVSPDATELMGVDDKSVGVSGSRAMGVALE